MPNQDLRRLAASACLVASGLTGAGACNHAWSALDPVATSTSTSTSASASASASTSAGSGGGGSGSSASSGSSSSSSSAAASTGTGGAGGGGAAPHCGAVGLLTWDFSSDQPGQFYENGGVVVQAGEGVIKIPTTTGGYWEREFTSLRVYDARSDRAFVKVTQVPDVASLAAVGLSLKYDNGDGLFLRESKGAMFCGSSHKGIDSASQAPYDPVAHVYWQLREDQGMVHCETSPDGTTWSDLDVIDLSTTVLSPPSAVHVALHAIANGANTVAGEVHFDDLDGGGPPVGHWCKASTFTDGFPAADPVPGPEWDRSFHDGMATLDQAGGTLNITDVAASGAGYLSSAAYDATGERVSIGVAALPTSAQGTASFRLDSANGFVGWSLHSDVAQCISQTGMGPTGTIWQGPLPPLPAYVGMREAGGHIYCTLLEPTDGGAPVWKDLGSIVTGLDVSAADVSIFVYPTSGNVATWVASFEGYNLPPVP